jgi:hypothetical protein
MKRRFAITFVAAALALALSASLALARNGNYMSQPTTTASAATPMYMGSGMHMGSGKGAVGSGHMMSPGQMGSNAMNTATMQMMGFQGAGQVNPDTK